MGRLRTRLASHYADREAGRRLSDADQALHMAMDAYRGVLKTGTAKEKRRAATAIDNIRRCLRVLGQIQLVGERYDVSDPDLVPESEKVVRPSRSKAERVE